MQGHLLALLDKEEDQAVVIVGLDRHFVQGSLKMVRVLGSICALDTQFLQWQLLHGLDNLLARAVLEAVVQEVDVVVGLSGLHAHGFHLVYETAHRESSVGTIYLNLFNDSNLYLFKLWLLRKILGKS